MLPAAPQQQALLLALLVKATVLIHDKSGEALIAVANFENVSANATLSLADGREVDNKVLTARAVEGFQPMSTFSLDSPMSIGAKRGYMLRASLKGTGITKARQLTDDDAATTTVVTTQERRANQTGTARVINQTDVFVWAAMPKNLTHMGQQKLRPGVYGPKFPEGKTPALVFTGKTLIAFAQGKPIVVSRSTSFGKDWSSSRALVDDAENPAPVWVPASRRLLFLYKSITGHVYMLMESVDEGLSFSAPRRICEACMVGVVPLMKRWGFQLPGPPGGIVASTGRIVQCCDHMLSSKTTCGNPQTPGGGNADGSQCDKGNHILFSDDNGVHWNVSKPVAQGPPAFGDECSVAQLPGTNTLVLNTRVDSGNKQLTPFGYGRATAFSTDWGETWGDAARRPTLPDGICGGDMISIDVAGVGPGLLTSNVNGGCRGPNCHEFSPPSEATRQNLTLHFSTDGVAWRPIVKVWGGNATYSSMADLGNGLVGVLYDQGVHAKIVYAVVALGR